MGYIARTNGGDTILELREAALGDITESERANWRAVTEAPRAQLEKFVAIWTQPTFEVRSGEPVMTWQYALPPDIWLRMRLKQQAALVRWGRTQAGITLPDGTAIATDDASQAKIHQAYSMLKEGWAQTLNFKTTSGFVTIDLAAMTAISQAVAAYVQGCFTAEEALLAAIDEGTVTTAAQINGWSWP